MDEVEPAVADVVVGIIRDRLRKGLLIPGQRIVGSELATELGVSRLPVREALNRLTGEGLIVLDKNRSPRIRAVDSKDLADMLRVQGALANLGMRLACSTTEANRDPRAERKRLAEIIQAIIEAAEDQEYFEFNFKIRELNTTLAEVANNNYLRRALDSLHSEYFPRDLAPRLTRDQWTKMASNYRKIQKLIKSGNGQAASELYQQHLDWIVEELFGKP